jgi:hypothetical protein
VRATARRDWTSVVTSPRAWVWLAVLIQIAGLMFDVLWHGLLHPGFEATSVPEMVAHLSTVHLPIYLGVLAVLVTTTWALVDGPRHGRAGIALSVAFAGALLAVTGEAWHAYTHLQLSTHGGPLAAATSALGLVVVIVAVWRAGRGGRRQAGGSLDRRRAA